MSARIFQKSYIVLIFSALLLLSACVEVPNCAGVTDGLLKIGFRTVVTEIDENDVPITEIRDTAVVLSDLRLANLPDTSFIDSAGVALSRLNIRVNPYADSTTLIIDMEGVGPRQLVVRYDRNQRFISPECGIEQRFTNLKFTDNLEADSVILLRNEIVQPVTGDDAINILVYL